MPDTEIWLFIMVAAALVGLAFTTACSPGENEGTLTVATTTSLETTGLLEALAEEFYEDTSHRVQFTAVGSGQALKMADGGDADAVLVHAPRLEAEFVRESSGLKRHTMAHSEFVLLGPLDDPAEIAGMDSVRKAFSRLADRRTPFVSRGDDSGTHQREISLWESSPSGEWYIEAGSGMGAVLRMASQKGAYTLSDLPSYLVVADELDLEVLVCGDPELKNPYSVIAVDPDAHPGVNYPAAEVFIEWLTGPPGQKVISRFGAGDFDEPLFRIDEGNPPNTDR